MGKGICKYVLLKPKTKHTAMILQIRRHRRSKFYDVRKQVAPVYLHCTIWPPTLLMLHSCPTLVSKPLIPHLFILYLLSLPLTTNPSSWLSFCASCLLSPPDFLRVLQWNAGGLRARSTELLHFLLSHPVDLICIQESNLNSSSSFQIPGFSALRSDHTHSQSGILSPDATHASSSGRPNLLLGSHLHFNPTPTFLGVTFDRTLSFSKHVSLLKVNFFPLYLCFLMGLL